MAAINAPSIILVILSTICALNADQVPVLMWRQAPEKAINKMISGLDILESSEFENFVDEYAGEKDSKKVVFVAEHFSTRDLACRTSDKITCFKQLSQMPNKAYLPAVRDPIELLTRDSALELYVTSDGELSQDVSNVDQNVLVISLPERYHDETNEAHKMRCDRIIAKATEDLLKINPDYVFMLTGHRMPQKSHLRKARDVAGQDQPNKQAPITTAESNVTLRSPNLLLFAREVYDQVKNEKGEIVNQKVDLTGINVKSASDSVLSVEITGTGAKKPFTLDIKFNNSVSYWTIDSVSVGGSEARGRDIIAVPSNSSFKCSPGLRFRVVNSTDRVGFVIKGLQLQPRFGSQTEQMNRFSNAIDCVGFTSVGIWAGIFVTFLLLFIVSIGITWIMDIRTMDRFDDPKGKTITVSVSE